MVLIGYLPVAKLDCFSKSKRAHAGYQLFHDCMRSLLRPLVQAGLDGVDIVCADGFIRTVYPILAAYIADHPEQCLVTCVKENRCPKCLVRAEDRGTGMGKNTRWRDHVKTAEMLRSAVSGEKPTTDFNEDGLRPIDPFWADLPHADIFVCITPDILHQLHKGMFKEHVAKWASACIPGGDANNEVDGRFKCMPAHPELRHFRQGVSLVSQWTGTEYKNMEKVFLGVIAGAAPKEVALAVRGLLDFIYFAHFESHTSTSLSCLDDAWSQFHKYKASFRTHYALAKEMPANWANFDGIPKLHAMDHYLRSIRCLGTADGYNTEGTERLHIDFAKHGYRAGNKKKYIRQMTAWLDRQEAVHRFHAYLRWRQPTPDPVQGLLERDLHEKDDAKLRPQLEELDADEQTPQLEAHEDEEKSQGRTRSGKRIKYRVAKKPTYPQLKAAEVAERFGAAELSWYLEEFLNDKAAAASAAAVRSLPKIELSPDTRIGVYKQVKLELPVMTQVSKQVIMDTIHAVPAQRTVMEDIQIESTPAQFSTVLAYRDIRKSEDNGANSHWQENQTRSAVQGIYQQTLLIVFVKC